MNHGLKHLCCCDYACTKHTALVDKILLYCRYLNARNLNTEISSCYHDSICYLTKQDVADLRSFLDENGGEDIEIIAKIENRSGVDHVEEICEIANGIMMKQHNPPRFLYQKADHPCPACLKMHAS